MRVSWDVEGGNLAVQKRKILFEDPLRHMAVRNMASAHASVRCLGCNAL